MRDRGRVPRSGWGRWLRRAAACIAAPVALAAIVVVADGWKAFGHRADGARRARMERSPQWKNGSFENPQPLENHAWDMLTGLFHASADTSPSGPLPVEVVDPKR